MLGDFSCKVALQVRLAINKCYIISSSFLIPIPLFPSLSIGSWLCLAGLFML